MKVRASVCLTVSLSGFLYAQVVDKGGAEWREFGRDSQHGATSGTASQTLNAIHWTTAVDLSPTPTGSGDLLAHYGSALVTAANTVIVPVKTGAANGFEIRAFDGATGAALYTLPTDYSVPQPPASWIPPYQPALSAGTRLYFAGAGGTVYYRDLADNARDPNGIAGASGQIAFYGTDLYNANQAVFNSAVQISTPITADDYGNIFFGFVATGSNPANLVSGLARIGLDGSGSWVSAASLGGDSGANSIAYNAAPAMSVDGQTVYVPVVNVTTASGYMTAANANTLAPIARVELFDPRGQPATMDQISSASPMVGPDGDVYYGVLETPCCTSHNDRGWMLHFDATLSVTKIPGSFGWDDTASVVPASAVPSYSGKSSYLILTKYNNYAGAGTGNGVNKMAVLDPNASMQDEYSTTPVQVMQEVITVTGVTSDPKYTSQFPNAVREWCINSAVIDAVTKSALVNSEDGNLYRWDFTANALTQTVKLTSGIGEAYTPTMEGADGTVYAIQDAILFAVGK